VGVGLLGRALGLAGGVRQGKDDGPLVEAGHVPQDLRSEDTADSGGADQARGLQLLDDFAQVLQLKIFLNSSSY